MGAVDIETIPISSMGEDSLKQFLKDNGISLKAEEARSIPNKLGRDPTLTELHIFNIEWSEHCSYKSSKEILKLLPTDASNIIQGPKEDAGIVYFTTYKNERYGIVIGHESHNHPSQVVPFEGAATGIGGIVRDISCMGASVIANADPLRFGDPYGKNALRTKYIANEVINGIAGYGNPLGVPVIAGDIYFNSSFDDNCLVNVASLGLIKQSGIIHSAVPEEGLGYDIIAVGKATDSSGFGGAAFASLTLDDEENNKGAVQVPDPFLKNILLRANQAVFKAAKNNNIKIGFKDCGAGGIMCASSELGASGNFGMDINLNDIHTSMDIPPYIVACAETQERFVWTSPKEFTNTILKIYNEDFELPNIAEGAEARIIGKVIQDQDYILRHNNKIVCNAPIHEVTEGIRYKRPSQNPNIQHEEPSIPEPTDYNDILKKVLFHPNVASKRKAYKHYDTEVQGNTIIRPGEADAGLISPLEGSSAGVALSVDHNPRYSKIDPYWGAINGVAEAMRNIAAIGASPAAMTDCLCFGNPEKPDVFHGFVESVKGLAKAATRLHQKDGEPVPFISGNVSFYNESKEGNTIDPSPIIACVGIIDDYSKAITTKLKARNTKLFLLGKREDELGGSVYYDLFNHLGANIPKPNLDTLRSQIFTIIEAINKRLLLSCHDISDGGLAACIAEMCFGEDGKGRIGVSISLDDSLPSSRSLFSETPGFILEIYPEFEQELKNIAKENNIDLIGLGTTTHEPIIKISHNKQELINIEIKEAAQYWLNGFTEAIR